MKLVYSLLGLSLVLGGCSSSGVLGSLQLRAPGTNTSAAYEPNTVAAEPVQSAALDQPIAPAPVARAPAQDIYAKYGISKVKPDGTAKTSEELKAELKLAVLEEKRRKQPGYGTISNIGNIFSDG
jgi:hypothetical protein